MNMVHRIKSDMVLEKDGIQFEKKGDIRMPYERIVWCYLQKRTPDGSYRYYDLTDITGDMTGDIVLVDIDKDKYIFREKYLTASAGKVLEELLEANPACFAGYDSFSRHLYQTDFQEMVRACRLMREACFAGGVLKGDHRVEDPIEKWG